MALKVGIFGAGHGGITATADLTKKGHEVTLYQSSKSMYDLSKLKESGEIILNGESVKFHKFTKDIAEAIQGKDVLMLTIPAQAVETLAEAMSPHLEDGQHVYINSAASMCALRFRRVLNKMKNEVNIKVGESMSLSYAARYDSKTNEADLIHYHEYNLFAAYPSRDTKEMAEVISRLYEYTIPAKNILETTLNNGNPESHPGPSILNAGRIDYAGDSFYLYKEGITEHTVNVVHQIDKERSEICTRLGLEAVQKSVRSERSGYFEKGLTLLEQFNTSEILKDIVGPTHLENRYVTEDVSNGLVLWASIGDAIGVDTPVMDSVITLTGTLLNKNYFEIGVTLKKLDIDVSSVEELNDLMEKGI